MSRCKHESDLRSGSITDRVLDSLDDNEGGGDTLLDYTRSMATIAADASDRLASGVANMTDQDLWIAFMSADDALSGDVPGYDYKAAEVVSRATAKEIDRRFGAAATERTASYAVAVKMSGDELIAWARDNFPHLLSVAKGETK